MEYEKKQKIQLIILSVITYLLCITLLFIGILNHITNKGRADAIKGGIIVEAEWASIITNGNGRAPSTYDLGYEYVDENGIIYREKCPFTLQSYEEAKSYMGKKVEIYIDGKGHSIPVYEAKNFNINDAWITMGIAIGIAVCYTAGLIIWGVINHRRKKQESIECASSGTV